MVRLFLALALLLGVNGAAHADTMRYLDVTLTPDTAILANGDVIDATTVLDAFSAADKRGTIVSVEIIDEDDQKAAFDIYFTQGSAALGTENSAPGISDANARAIMGWVAVATGDYKDIGGVSIGLKTGLNIAVGAGNGQTAMYVGVVNGSGTPTYTASGLKLRIGLLEQP